MRITPEHINAMGLLVLIIGCSLTLLLALVFAAFQLVPPSLALDLFRSCSLGAAFLVISIARRLRH